MDKLTDHKRLSQLIILVGFLATFSLIRYFTLLQKLHILPNQTGDLHIHHFVPGIFLVLVGGFVGISFWPNQIARRFSALVFGIGAGLTIDEFALWLYLEDVYWSHQGRNSIDAIIIVTAILVTVYTLSEIYDHRHIKKIVNSIKDPLTK